MCVPNVSRHVVRDARLRRAYGGRILDGWPQVLKRVRRVHVPAVSSVGHLGHRHAFAQHLPAPARLEEGVGWRDDAQRFPRVHPAGDNSQVALEDVPAPILVQRLQLAPGPRGRARVFRQVESGGADVASGRVGVERGSPGGEGVVGGTAGGRLEEAKLVAGLPDPLAVRD